MLEERPKGATEFATLRQLLVGPERQQLDELADRVEQVAITPETLADQLPEAIALRAGRDHQLGRALAPTVETALRESIRRNPHEIASAIFPVLGPAIRKAIAETMAGLVRSINRAVEYSLSIQGMKWRIEAWRTGVPFPEVVIKHALVYRVEQIFLIHAETGLLLAHATAPDLSVPHADLISGMLTAIQDFVRDSFRPGEGGTLSSFTVGEHTVHVEAGPLAFIAGVIRGQCPDSVPRRLQLTLEQIHLEYATPLADFQGDAAPFASATSLLEANLETVLSTDRTPGRATMSWLRWAMPLALAALVLLGLAAASWMRWRRAIRVMEAEPGFLIVDASRSWGRWSFRGLKDPLARDARTVLAGASLLPRAIDAQFKPYVSLDSAMVVERARERLGVPATTMMALAADTLRLSGSAPISWLRKVDGATSVVGVAYVDASVVQPTLDTATAALKQKVETTHILFDPGSSSMTESGIATVRVVSETLRRLLDSASTNGTILRVDLVGRTDPTGSDATNQSLAGLRIEAVARRLGALGVPSAFLRARPVATSQPLPGATGDEAARINRSVSFEVVVANGSRGPRGP